MGITDIYKMHLLGFDAVCWFAWCRDFKGNLILRIFHIYTRRVGYSASGRESDGI